MQGLDQNLLAFYREACYHIAAVLPASTQERSVIREFETILT